MTVVQRWSLVAVALLLVASTTTTKDTSRRACPSEASTLLNSVDLVTWRDRNGNTILGMLGATRDYFHNTKKDPREHLDLLFQNMIDDFATFASQVDVYERTP